MPGNLFVGIAISVIVIGFVILAGVAIWLAAERRRTLSAGQGRPAPQRGSQPAAQQQPPAEPKPASQGQQAAPQPAASAAAAPEKASSAAPATPQAQKEVHPSGEYPSAATYDQTILPEPPRRRTRPRSQ